MESIRRPRAEDASVIHQLVTASDIDVIGQADSTLDDIADQLAEPGFDLERDAWLSHDDDGRPNAWAWACRNGDSDLVDIEVIVRPGADPSGDLAGRLWRTVLGRAGELARERGHDGATVDIGIYRADEARQALARQHGFEPGTSYHRLRIDHDGPLDPPAPLPGLTLHTGETDDVRREAHRIHQEGFAEHFGFVPVDYEQWHERRQAQSVTDWSRLTVARIDGRPAAVAIGNDQFVSDEGCGYVATLAVLPAFRGRGLGRFLLRHAFAADAARGRKGTILHVDSNNATPALDLYLSAGMRLVLVIDIWRRRI
ncbi:GNAT family N-acetyltransferase [Nonomuraea sp. NPDC048916]|uniref:GNAT family N-acetyltransferase n=1 Tax=Nonomuraea sp. NPDC048916 TaxID=3154232 RepID=UPI0033DBEFF0